MMGYSKLLILATAVVILAPGCSTTDKRNHTESAQRIRSSDAIIHISGMS